VLGAALQVVLCAAQLKLATVGFTQHGLTDAQASFFAEHFSVQLQRAGDDVRVTTPKDLETVLGVEKQKQLLGCADDSSSCMAEIAEALGAAGLVTGQIAKVGQRYQLNVKIMAPEGTKTLYLHSSELLPSEEALIAELNAVAADAVAKLRPATGGTVTAAPAGKQRSKLKLIPGAVGVAALLAGGVGLAQAGAQYGALSDSSRWQTLEPTDAMQLREGGKLALGLGLTLAIAGAVLIVASALWYLLT